MYSIFESSFASSTCIQRDAIYYALFTAKVFTFLHSFQTDLVTSTTVFICDILVTLMSSFDGFSVATIDKQYHLLVLLPHGMLMMCFYNSAFTSVLVPPSFVIIDFFHCVIFSILRNYVKMFFRTMALIGTFFLGTQCNL